MVTQYIFDDFNDGVIDPVKWLPGSSPSGLQSESGGELRTPAASSSAPTILYQDRNFYDMRKGRLAVKFSRGGTTNADTYTYFGFSDPLNNWFTLFCRSSDSNIQLAANTAGAGTFTQEETTVGLGPSWVNGTWFGVYYSEPAKTYYFTKSTNGVTWTGVCRYAVTTSGALNYKRCGLILGATSYATVPTFTPRWDDVSYFAEDPDLKARVRFGGSLVVASPKVRVDGAWKRPIGLQRVGGTWVRGK